MLLWNVKRSLLGVVLAGLVCTTAAVSAQGRAADPAPATKEPRVRSLLKERLKILRDRAARLREQQRRGIVSPDMVWNTDIRLYKAELELCEKDQDRIAWQEKIVNVYRSLEDHGRQQQQRGAITQEVLDEYILSRLEAEIALERLKGDGRSSSK